MNNIYGQTNSRRVQITNRVILGAGTLSNIQATANDLILGPNAIFVQRNPSDSLKHFERILHIVGRVPNSRIQSWSVFRQDREWEADRGEDHYGWVLANAAWDKKTDLTTQPWKSGRGPTMLSKIRYVTDPYCAPLIPLIRTLDSILLSGVTLNTRNKADKPSWSEFSFIRLLDSASIDLTWNSFYENLHCEKAGFSITRAIETIIEEHQSKNLDSIELLKMSYERSPYLPIKEYSNEF